MPPPRCVLFDFDGVIADTEWLHSETFRQVLEEEGIRLTDREHTDRFLGINDRAAFPKAFLEVGRALDSAQVEALVARKSVFYSQRIGDIPLFPGVRRLIEDLAPRVMLAVASGGRVAEIEAVLSRHGVRAPFLAVVSADHVARSKPAPDVFLAALEAVRLAAPGRSRGLEAPDCLVIEDSILGIAAAKAAGMRCIAVEHSFPREKLGAADLVVGRIADIEVAGILQSL